MKCSLLHKKQVCQPHPNGVWVIPKIVFFLLGITWNFQICTERSSFLTLPMEWGWGLISHKVYFAMNWMKCPNLQKSNVCQPSTPTPKWGGWSIPTKLFFDMNQMECPDMQRKVMFFYPYPNGSGDWNQFPKNISRNSIRYWDMFGKLAFTKPSICWGRNGGLTYKKWFFSVGIVWYVQVYTEKLCFTIHTTPYEMELHRPCTQSNLKRFCMGLCASSSEKYAWESHTIPFKRVLYGRWKQPTEKRLYIASTLLKEGCS